MERPLAEWESAADPWLFGIFQAFAVSFCTFSYTITIGPLQRSQATFGIRFKMKQFFQTLFGALSEWNYHTGTGIAPDRVEQSCSTLDLCIFFHAVTAPVSYTHLTLPTIYSV